VLSSILSRFRSDRVVPDDLKRIFFHLYLDVAWIGILSGSGASFISIYAARLGADTLQISLLTAGPAMVGLLATLPVGRWLRHRPIGNATFWSAFFSRIGYFFWILLPVLLPPQAQIWTFIGMVLIMTLPGTGLAIGYNALYATAVPPEWRAHVVGIRNAVLSLTLVISSLVCGYLLNYLPFTFGYQVIFGMGFLGAAMSTFHLWFLRSITVEPGSEPALIRESLGDRSRTGMVRVMGINLRANVGLRAFTRGTNLLRAEVLRGEYGRVVVALFAFHFAQFLPVALFPLYWVDRLHFSDGEISIGTAAFHLAVLAGSTQLDRLNRRWSNHRLTAIGALLLSTYPLLTAFTPNLEVYVVTSLLGGIAWALVGGAVGNYLLEKVPPYDRPAYLAWYNLALNAAILLGSLGGPVLVAQIGLPAALIVSAVMRAVAAGAIWRAD
jgi:hypothetical protein